MESVKIADRNLKAVLNLIKGSKGDITLVINASTEDMDLRPYFEHLSNEVRDRALECRWSELPNGYGKHSENLRREHEAELDAWYAGRQIYDQEPDWLRPLGCMDRTYVKGMVPPTDLASGAGDQGQVSKNPHELQRGRKSACGRVGRRLDKEKGRAID
jgi:hypothetical protein